MADNLFQDDQPAPKKAKPSTRRNWLLDRIRLDRSLGVSTLWEQYTARYKGGYPQFLDDYEAAQSVRSTEIRRVRESVDILEDTWELLDEAIQDANTKGSHTALARLIDTRDRIFRPDTAEDLSHEALKRIWDRTPIPKRPKEEQ
ncbi:MAG: hypothetical protein OXR67_01725 [Chloroflexota bacterium]|nr:hypothetical protein [Chloroflexota bacterium]